MTARTLPADPLVTASIYADRALDGVVHGAVGPALRRLRAEHPGAAWGAWWVRYSKHGDHLKVRLHGPAPLRDEARAVLEEEARRMLDALPPRDETRPRISNAGLPSIDAQDDAAGDHPDRSLLWTDYARSHVSFGPRELLGEDGYVARICTCLAAGAEVVLAATALDETGAIPGAQRQRALLRAVLAGIAAAPFTPDERAEYLRYHRGWLVRFSVPDESREADVLAGFDRQAERMRAGADQVARAAAARWAAEAAPAEGDTPDARFGAAVGELCAYAAPFRHDPARQRDPFAEDASFPLLFKALHGIANQAGLNLLNEAYLYHLLPGAAEPAGVHG
jgi:Lantibiotic biosynthesis dehydratase C-term